MLADVTDDGDIEIYTKHGVVCEGECDNENKSEAVANNVYYDSDISVACLENVSDNDELIKVKRLVAIRKYG